VAKASFRLLVLGGTKFLGRHLTEAALAAGHAVTLFHRGAGGCTLYPEAEHVHGDRDGGLDRLVGRRWDAVVDTSGYVPRLVGDSVRFLAEAAGHYTFISSISVYASFTAGMDESAPVAVLPDPSVEEITGETYGGLKALCEDAVLAAFPGRSLIVRSGLIVGPHDPTDRFTYWVRRVSTGGEVLVPGPPDRPLQFIHAGDLAAWMLRAAEAGAAGIMNVTGPEDPVPMERFLETCREAAGSDASWIWADEAFLKAHDVAFWQEVPLCIEAKDMGVLAVDISRATAAGLRSRPILQTVRDTLGWDLGRPPGTELAAGLTASREAALLEALRAGS
jgi:2'-hydroxyisoflavone reductase